MMKSWNSTYFDKKLFWTTLGTFVACIPLQMATGGAGYALLAPFALIALAKRQVEMVVFWIMLAVTLMMGNTYLFPKGPVFFIAQRAVLIIIGGCMLSQLFGRSMSRIVSPFMGLMPFLVAAAVSSALGWAPLVSFLKLFLFTMIYLAYCGMANLVLLDRRADARKIRAIFLAVACFFILGSVVVIPFPGISQMTGEEYMNALKSGGQVLSLFKGVTMHSQTLGTMVAVIAILLVADMAFNMRRAPSIYVILSICAPLLIYKSSSRAAMATYIVGLLGIVYLLMQAKGIGGRWRSKIFSVLMFIVVILVAAVMITPSLRDGVVRFALKYDKEAKSGDFSMEQAMMTRQGLADDAIMNFKKSPMLGNGFQVYEEMSAIKASDWKSILSAPIEKGVWLTAVLEETGVIGFSVLWCFIIGSAIKLLRRKAYCGLIGLASIFILNMAEFTMFAMSAMGGFVWALVFIGAMLDGLRVRDDRKAMQFNPFTQSF